jgi:iron-sulfur cluster repair protein YtfE (RIC family)
MTATLDQTIREIVATDYRTAAAFQRHGLDFCCNGCRTIEQGCRDTGCRPAYTEQPAVNVISLATPLTPAMYFTALSAATRWCIHRTVPSSVMNPSATTACTPTGTARLFRSR